MGVPIQQVLANHFYLEDHPFSPHIDHQNNFDFQKNKALLTKPLDVFRVNDLDRYYSKVGVFGSEIARVTAFLNNLGLIDEGRPPAILVEGERGCGADSMANYIAYLIKQRCQAPPTLLSMPPVDSENRAKGLLAAEMTLEMHIEEQHLQGCDALLRRFNERIHPTDPDEMLLKLLFSNLRPKLEGAPWLILISGPVTYLRSDWINTLHEQLSPLNVSFIFITDDPKVTVQFESQVQTGNIIPGHTVRLTGLDRKEGQDLLEARMKFFRLANSPANKVGLFPFEQVAFDQLFQGHPQNKVVIKKLIEHCQRALNKKVGELSRAQGAAPPSPFITWDYFTTTLAEVIRAGGARSS
jgi:hypothetical protein